MVFLMCDWGGPIQSWGILLKYSLEETGRRFGENLGARARGGIMKEKGIRVPTFPLTSLVISDWQVTDDN